MARRAGEASGAVDLDSLLLAELDYLRLRPFGSPRVSERLERTPNLSRLAAQLYGPAETPSARDQHQRALLRSAARQMDGTAGEALLALLGLTRETSGRSRAFRLDMAGPLMHPHPLAGPSLGRAQYWQPFLEQAVVALRGVGVSPPGHVDKQDAPLRDLTLPVVERELIDVLAHSIREPFDPATRAYVLYGPPGSGRFTTCDEALSRVTTQNRHVVRLVEPAVYHRDLLEVLSTYVPDANSWSLAACECEFQLLVERAPEALGGVILRGANSAEQVQHLLPRRPGATVVVTARYPSRASLTGVNQSQAEPFREAEATSLLLSGHPGTATQPLADLTTLLYGHVGLVAAAARSRLTVATLIRRLRRHRIDQVLELALHAGIDLEDDARRTLSALRGDRDTVLALDLYVWLCRSGSWDLVHSLGYLLGRDASPARVSRAHEKLHRAGAMAERAHGLICDLLSRHRARRMTPLLHQLARLDIPDGPGRGLSIDRQSGSGVLRLDTAEDSPEVTLLEFVPNNERGYGAIFTDSAGKAHAQLWRFSPDDPDAYILYEDGHPRGDHRLLDPDRDSAWPHLTRHMISILADDDLPSLSDHGRTVTIQFFEGPAHHDVAELWDAPVVDLDDLLAAPEADDIGADMDVYVRDESVDKEVGELFA